MIILSMLPSSLSTDPLAPCPWRPVPRQALVPDFPVVLISQSTGETPTKNTSTRTKTPCARAALDSEPRILGTAGAEFPPPILSFSARASYVVSKGKSRLPPGHRYRKPPRRGKTPEYKARQASPSRRLCVHGFTAALQNSPRSGSGYTPGILRVQHWACPSAEYSSLLLFFNRGCDLLELESGVRVPESTCDG